MFKVKIKNKQQKKETIFIDSHHDPAEKIIEPHVYEDDNTKSHFFVRIYFNDVFGFKHSFYGLGYKLWMKRNESINVVVHWLGEAHPENVFILWERFISGDPIYLSYIERSVSVRDLNEQNIWFFDVRVKGGIGVPLFINKFPE